MAMMGDGEEDRLIDTNTFTFHHNTIYNILCLIFIRPQISQIEILVSLTNCLLANSNCSLDLNAVLEDHLIPWIESIDVWCLVLWTLVIEIE